MRRQSAASLRRREFYHDLFVGCFLVFALCGACYLVLR